MLARNAGVSCPVGSAANVDAEGFAQSVAINLIDPLRCICRLLPATLKAGWARIADVTTGAAYPSAVPSAAA